MLKTLILAITFASIHVYAADEATRAEQREHNQEQRIDNGIKDGSLTEKEAARLNRQQERIEKREDHMKEDGKISSKEKARLERQQDRASRDIHRAKHNKKHR